MGRDCRNMGLLMLIDDGAGGWLPDCRNKGLMMLMMLGAGFGIAGTLELQEHGAAEAH